MHRILLLLCAVALSFSVVGQDPCAGENVLMESSVSISHAAIFPGGKEALSKFFDENIVWTEAAYDDEAGGEVLVDFHLSRFGIVSDIRSK